MIWTKPMGRASTSAMSCSRQSGERASSLSQPQSSLGSEATTCGASSQRRKSGASDGMAARRIRSVNRLGAIYLRALKDDRRDAPRVRDVVQRVRVEHNEVGALARLERAGIGEAQELGRVAR